MDARGGVTKVVALGDAGAVTEEARAEERAYAVATARKRLSAHQSFRKVHHTYPGFIKTTSIKTINKDKQ